MNKSIKMVSMAVSLLLLQGCARVNTQFDCPHGNTGMCAGMSTVNQKVNEGAFDAPASGNNVKALSASANETNPFYNTWTIAHTPNHSKAFSQNPSRHPETVLAIWIAPYEDVEGNYHTGAKIFHVVKPGYWIDKPVKSS